MNFDRRFVQNCPAEMGMTVDFHSRWMYRPVLSIDGDKVCTRLALTELIYLAVVTFNCGDYTFPEVFPSVSFNFLQGNLSTANRSCVER